MKIVLTLLFRDEADIVRENIEFHSVCEGTTEWVGGSDAVFDPV